MTTIETIFSELKTASHPVARALHKSDHFKVLMLGFNKGMILQDHKAHVISKLTVLSGVLIYKEGSKEIKLLQYYEVDIPLEITHSVEALEDSLCLLTKG